MSNGELLLAAETRFELFVTDRQNLRYQQTGLDAGSGVQEKPVSSAASRPASSGRKWPHASACRALVAHAAGLEHLASPASALRPTGRASALDAPAGRQIRLVQVEVDRRPGAIVLARRVDDLGVAEHRRSSAKASSENLWGAVGSGGPERVSHHVSQEELRIRADEPLGKAPGWARKYQWYLPLPRGGRRSRTAVGRHDVEDRELAHPRRVVERHAIGHAPPAVGPATKNDGSECSITFTWSAAIARFE